MMTIMILKNIEHLLVAIAYPDDGIGCGYWMPIPASIQWISGPIRYANVILTSDICLYLFNFFNFIFFSPISSNIQRYLYYPAPRSEIRHPVPSLKISEIGNDFLVESLYSVGPTKAFSL